MQPQHPSLPRLLLSTTLLSTASVLAATGGQYCSTALCINAIVSDDRVTYQLKSTLGFETLGWMGVGFGSQMPNSPMVITWPNEDGTITLSQREAPAHVMPTVVSNPAQVAELAWENSILATNTTTIAFHYPLPSTLSQVDMIWAWSGVRPSSSAKDAGIQQHTDMGALQLDLTQPMSALPTGTLVTSVVGTSTAVGIPVPTETSSGQQQNPMGSTATDLPLSQAEKNIRTHAILMSLGFLVFLPLGVFVARFSRTVPALKNKWFTAHWFIQFVVSGPLIFAGWAKGYQEIGPGLHFQDKHTKIGLALLVLYLVQLLWGTLIHFFKPASFTAPLPPSPTPSPAEHPKETSSASSATHVATSAPQSSVVPAITGRPVQNYLHAINGIAIVALAFYNVRYGYHVEWPRTFGTTAAFLRSLNAWWISWVAIVPVIYILGVVLLVPRQWRMEVEARRERSAAKQPSSA